MPPSELCELRELVRHRDQWVRMRTRVKNALQGLALAHGLRRGAGLWTQRGQATLAALRLAPYAGGRRSALQALHDHLGAGPRMGSPLSPEPKAQSPEPDFQYRSLTN